MTNREAVLRSLVWHAVLGYPPTLGEIQAHAEALVEKNDLEALVAEDVVVQKRGRYMLRGEEHTLDELERRERFFPRKWAKIERLARILRWVPTIRFFAICNTTAIGNARDVSDIDLFFVVHPHSAWITRALLAGVARLIGRRPGERDADRDAWCFSFFVTDRALSFKELAKQPQDPYLAWWTLCLLPMFDDGVGAELWAAQSWAWSTRPRVRPWVAWHSRPRRRWTWGWDWLDRGCFLLQKWFGSKQLWEAAQTGESDVIFTRDVIKLHLDDRREVFRDQYESRCKILGIAPYLDAR